MKVQVTRFYSNILYFSLNKRFRSVLSSSDIAMKVFTQKRNPITGGTEWDMQLEDYDFHQEIARSAFADMLHDTERNKKYYRALQLAIEKMHRHGKKANVLDIGTGTGLLSIMAARCGADSIVACEAFKPMAECCEKILKVNGVADKIQVIPKRSTEITIGQHGDMKQKANILVTEVFDTELIGEGALHTFSHAHKHLLEADCIVIPDSAVIYAQVVACPTLQKWNKLNDLADEDTDIILTVPQKIKNCPGAAAVHDIQLSQIERNQFIEISEPLPVLYYDWSGKSDLSMKTTVKQQFTAKCNEEAQMVFFWWELNMDPEGRIVISCAPWWAHPDASLTNSRPQDTIPWRDHWMQAVYYLPKVVKVTQSKEMTLVCCQDEYSLWFYLEGETSQYASHPRPVCECGVHMAFSRTHIAYLNDGVKSKKLLSAVKKNIDLKKEAIVLDLNGSSFLGLAAAKMGAKKVYILETVNLNKGILKDYMQENEIDNVECITEVDDELLKRVTDITCDLVFSSSILPWENLKLAHLLHKFKGKLRDGVSIVPESCEFWAMPVEFNDLHKIRIPLGNCEGISMAPFDELVESSRTISDAEIEAQPLWEYPCKCRGEPRKLISIDFRQPNVTYANNETHILTSDSEKGDQSINGFAIWPVWRVEGSVVTGGAAVAGAGKGAGEGPAVGDYCNWDSGSRQAVKLLSKTYVMKASSEWSFQVACDLNNGQFDLNLDLVLEETMAEDQQ